MVSLKDACMTILRKHTKERIFRVCEYDTAYECLLINRDEDPVELRELHGILPAVVCNKVSGAITDDLLPGEWNNYSEEPFRFYEAEEIENLLKEGKRGS